MLLEEWAGPRKGRILCGLVGNFYSLRTKKIPMERSGVRYLVRILFFFFFSSMLAFFIFLFIFLFVVNFVIH